MTTEKAITVIESLDQVPEFASEDEEAAFWDTHEMSDALWASLPRIPDELLPPVRHDNANERSRARRS